MLAPVDAPLGETKELYEVVISGMAEAIERQSNTNSLTISSAELGTLGTGPATIAVRQIGDWAGSWPAEIVVSLP